MAFAIHPEGQRDLLKPAGVTAQACSGSRAPAHTLPRPPLHGTVLSDASVGFLRLLPLEEGRVLQGCEGQGHGQDPARPCKGKAAQGRGKPALEPDP